MSAPQIDPGEGWRLLTEGETISNGDESWAYGTGPWSAVSPCFHGKPWGETWREMRRRIQPTPVGAPQDGLDLAARIMALPCWATDGWDTQDNATLEALRQTYGNGFRAGLRAAAELAAASRTADNEGRTA